MKRAIIGLALVSLSGCGYNRIQTYDEAINAFKSQIEVQLQRRSDLIPNLVATVRGFADQEEEVFTSIAEARSRLGGAIQSGDPSQMAEANQSLTQGLGRLLVISEAYPETAFEPELHGVASSIGGHRKQELQRRGRITMTLCEPITLSFGDFRKR